jgi:hypothetical protein
MLPTMHEVVEEVLVQLPMRERLKVGDHSKRKNETTNNKTNRGKKIRQYTTKKKEKSSMIARHTV